MNLQHIFDLAQNQLVQLSILIVATAIIVPIVDRRRAHLAYVLWLAVLIKSLAPPIWSSPLGVFSYRPVLPHSQTQNSAVVFDGPAYFHPAIAAPAMTPTSSPSHAWNPTELAIMTWSVGCLGFLAIVAVRWIVLQRRIARSSVEPSSDLSAMVRQLSQHLGVRRQIPLRVCDDAIGPAIIGFLRPTLVIPSIILRDKTSAQLRPLLAHEIIHLRRGDPLVAGLQLLSQAVWWFNPLVWWTNRQITRTREICCDAEVIAGLQCPREGYAQMLIDILRLRRSVGGFVAAPGIRPVQITMRRLQQIMNDGPSHARTPWRYWALLAICVLVILPGAAFSDGQSATMPSNNEIESQPSPSEPTPVDPNLATMERQRSEIAAQIDEMLKEGYGDQNPRIAYLKDKLAVLDLAIDKVVQNTVAAGHGAQALRIRHFVMLIVDVNGITFQGRKTTLDQLTFLLNQIPDRQQTVLQLGYASGDVTMRQFSEVQDRATQLVTQLGFEYLSLTGEHPANSMGSPDRMVAAPGAQPPVILPALTPAPVSELTHVVQFQLGQSQFLPGDKITITEVRATSDHFEVDGTYQVTGTYTLASHDSATLALSVTAKDPKNAWGNWGTKQAITIHKGSGTFTLTERMPCEGGPHISFYADSGTIGGVYFGTGSWVSR